MLHNPSTKASIHARARVCRENLPQFEPKNATLEALIAQGNRLAQEQEHVMTHRLSEEYNKNTGASNPGLIGLKG